MRRADRLLQIIQLLRRARGPISASRMAEELEVSTRTLYRDMVSLEASGVPVRGEAGIGYVLEEGYDMPPLMFTASELEALSLGARMLDGRVDDSFSNAAKDAVAKIAAVLPRDLREVLVDAPYFAPTFQEPVKLNIDLAQVRHAMRDNRQVSLHYRDLQGQESNRVIWPILVSIFPEVTMLAAWCTTRSDFRSFRLDGMLDFTPLDAPMPERRKSLLAKWRKHQIATLKERTAQGYGLEAVRGI